MRDSPLAVDTTWYAFRADARPIHALGRDWAEDAFVDLRIRTITRISTGREKQKEEGQGDNEVGGQNDGPA